MIYDKLENLKKYKGISKWLDKALEFLEGTELAKLPLGRTAIWEDKVFANVMEAQASDVSEGKFEIHRRYMDIQIDLEGTEIIQVGLDAEGVLDEFDPAKDFGTVICRESVSCIMGKNRFIVCMAEEPHKPGIAATENRFLKKCVVKVAVT
ncbi:MAG: YhcH/YjgK/YiaL family protein [Eubacteriales bacterium]|nr:YhcH/YjgK/YiaL family protein [Eubacteriales bacterium]